MKIRDLWGYVAIVIVAGLAYFLEKSAFFNYNLFATNFISLIMEGIPFLLLGAIVSSAIHLYVPENFFNRLNKLPIIFGLLVALILGIFFPLCECAIIPVIARMIKKGLYPSIGIAFMLAAPIVNPVTLVSTYTAFYPKISFLLARSLGGAIIALIIGLFIHFYLKNKISLRASEHHEHAHSHPSSEKNNAFQHIKAVSSHTMAEFLGVAFFFVIGSGIASLVKAYVPQQVIFSLGTHNFFSIMSMMALAFVLNVCSQADAFIAQSFYGYFNNASLISFLVYGPMLDIKNTTVLFRHFEKKFVFLLIILITILTLAFGLALKYGGF